MGADLYLPSFETNKARYESLFNKAVKERDSIFPRCFEGIAKIENFVRERLGQPKAYFNDPPILIPENMKLPAEYEAIREKYNKHARAQIRVSKYYNKMYEVGYFRDSYNGTSLFSRLGLSWWQCKLIDKKGNISPANAKKLLTVINSIKLRKITKEELVREHCTVDDGENSPESWNKYFSDKKKRFEEFLQEAIDNNWSIRASV